MKRTSLRGLTALPLAATGSAAAGDRRLDRRG